MLILLNNSAPMPLMSYEMGFDATFAVDIGIQSAIPRIGTDAASAVANSLPAGTQIGGQAIPQGPHMQYGYPDKTQLVSSLASSLVLASRKTANPWTMAKATKWILANATSVAALP